MPKQGGRRVLFSEIFSHFIRKRKELTK